VSISNPTNMTVPATDDLLRELRERGQTSGTYGEMEDALIGVMNAHQGVLSAAGDRP
jgi:hypothetical protein